MNEQKPESTQWETQNTRNTLRLRQWVIAWVVTSAITTFGPRFIWDFATGVTILAVLMTLAAGFGMILANKRHLNGLDEMHQKIFLDAAALTLGVGLVCGLSYEMLEDIRLITFEPEISHLVFLMCITFGIANIAGHRKYR